MNDPDMDYPSESGDPDDIIAVAPTRNVPEVPDTVAVQSSPSRLPALWPALVGEFMMERPLLGSHLLRTRLDWEDGETQGLRLVFLDRSAWSLIGDDGDFRKSIQGFLAGKAEGGNTTACRFTLDEVAAAEAASAAAPAMEALVSRDPMVKEPILRFIQDTFEGRML
jgi:hypothetical protein